MARVSVRLGRWSFRGSLKFVRVSFQTTSDTPLLTFVSVSILHLCSLLVAGRLLRLPLDCVKPYEAGKIACAPFPCPGRCLRLYMRFPLAFVALSGSGASLLCLLEAGVPIDPHTRHPLIFFLLFGVQLVDGRPPSEPDFIAWLKEWLAIPCDAYHPESLR